MDWDGYPVLVDNVFINSTNSLTSVTEPAKIFKVDDFFMYDWVVDDVNDIPVIVPQGAGTGAEWSKIVPIPTPGQGAVNVSTAPTLKWTKVGSKASNIVYFGKTNPPPAAETISGYTFQPGTLECGTVYYWKINDGDIWKFRTEGEPAAVTFPPLPETEKGPSGPLDQVVIHLNTGSGTQTLVFNRNGSDNMWAEMYNIKGNLFLAKNINTRESILETSHVSKGIYCFRLVSDQVNMIKKIFIE
jgi:hypothetical protein